jgi:hypothetical protein
VAAAVRTAAAHQPSRDRFLIRPPAWAVMDVFFVDGPVFRLSPAARAARIVVNFLPPVH